MKVLVKIRLVSLTAEFLQEELAYFYQAKRNIEVSFKAIALLP